MKIQSLNFNQNSIHNTNPQNQKNMALYNAPIKNKLGAFPSYYCPNINFGNKLDPSDFIYDFYIKAKDTAENHLDKMELTKNLSEEEQEDFRNNLSTDDKCSLLQFFYDKKPSVLLAGDFPYFKNNEKYDFVRRTITPKDRNNSTVEHQNIFIINKELTKNVIKENKELYTKRMNLNDDTSIDNIYKELVSTDSPLKKQYGYDDIIGITLGFSPVNSSLFQLERNVYDHLELRKHPYAQSEIFKQEFHSDDCVYKNFSNKFKSNVEDAIDSLKRPQPRRVDMSKLGYSVIQFVTDEKHTQKILNDTKDILNNY